MGFGHRGVAGEVYEQEGVKRLGHWSKAIGRGTAPEEILPISYTSSDKPSLRLRSAPVVGSIPIWMTKESAQSGATKSSLAR